jgi:MerR family transcriptional regulator, light-induced transcriptional regulator
MKTANPPGHRIQHVSEITGIPRNTLISWERRYAFLSPQRAPNGYRYYSDDDIELLRRVKALLNNGLRIGDAARLLLKSQLDPTVEVDTQLKGLCDSLLEALLSYDLDTAERLRSRMALMDFERIIDDIYVPLLIEVGARWRRGDILVAQEHFASAFCRAQLQAMLIQVGGKRRSAPLALFSGFPGERHEIGLLAVAVKLALRGFGIRYLGIDLSTSEVAMAARATKAHLVCHSVTVHRSPEDLHRAVSVIRAELPREVLLVLGGSGTLGHELDLQGVVLCRDLDDVGAATQSWLQHVVKE